MNLYKKSPITRYFSGKASKTFSHFAAMKSLVERRQMDLKSMKTFEHFTLLLYKLLFVTIYTSFIIQNLAWHLENKSFQFSDSPEMADKTKRNERYLSFDFE